MNTATWIVAVTSIGNLIVLGVYAYFTWGLWHEATRTALRTSQGLAAHCYQVATTSLPPTGAHLDASPSFRKPAS